MRKDEIEIQKKIEEEKIIIIDNENNIYINVKYAFNLLPASWQYQIKYGNRFNSSTENN